MPDKGHQLQQPPIVPQVDQASEPKKPVSGTVQVKLIRAVRLPAHCSAVVPVQAIGLSGLALLEPKEYLENCLKTDESLVEVGENGSTTMLWQVTLSFKEEYRTSSGSWGRVAGQSKRGARIKYHQAECSY